MFFLKHFWDLSHDEFFNCYQMYLGNTFLYENMEGLNIVNVILK